MDNLDDSENNAKISDSAYSNSCSNSQSRRSHSTKSTHSGSNSSGSSGYGGKPSTSGYSNNGQPPEKRSKDKESKKKKPSPVEILVETPSDAECRPPDPNPDAEGPKEEVKNDLEPISPTQAQKESGGERMEIVPLELPLCNEDEIEPCNVLLSSNTAVNFVTSRLPSAYGSEGFSCVISMHDGIVMYTTTSLTSTLGFPKDMWIGRSFIDFVHPRDRDTLASEITSGLAVPKTGVNGTQEKVQVPGNPVTTLVCRIRRYRSLTVGFGVKDRTVTFMPFLLKLSFKNINDDEGNSVYLVIQATPFFSAFKTANEVRDETNAVPFVLRHAANGNIEYIDPDSVPYLGYLPQDVAEKDALQLYHPQDLPYLTQVYETIVKEGAMLRSKPYRMMAQNGHFLKLETEWSSFINPWSRKLEFIIGKHFIMEGPANPDVFQSPEPDKCLKMTEEVRKEAHAMRENILRIMNEVLTKPAEAAKQQMTKRCQDLASFMESLMEETPKIDEELRIEIQDADNSYYERDSVMLGGISPHHEYNDSKSSTETPLSYNQLNYNETLQRTSHYINGAHITHLGIIDDIESRLRPSESSELLADISVESLNKYFDSHQPFTFEEYNAMAFGAEPRPSTSKCISPVAFDIGEMSPTHEPGAIYGALVAPVPLGECQPHPRLTETLIIRHNTEMEKEFVKKYRETRPGSKGEREKVSNETRKKKKEHLARCNASFQPTNIGKLPETTSRKSQGVKRTSKMEVDAGDHKHRCPSPRHTRRRPSLSQPCPNAAGNSSAAITNTVASAHWPGAPVNNMNAFILGMGISPQMSIMSPMTAVPGMFPMYYASPAAPTPMQTTSEPKPETTNANSQFSTIPVMMYGQAVYGYPLMYSPISPHVSYPLQHNITAQTSLYSNNCNPLGLATSNYEESCKPRIPIKVNKPHAASAWREKKRAEYHSIAVKKDKSGTILPSTTALNRETAVDSSNSQSGNAKSSSYSEQSSNSPQSTEAVPDLSITDENKIKTNRMGNSEEATDRTDEESSYSSFYSSFFKTESGSAEESSDAKRSGRGVNLRNPAYYEAQSGKKITRRKMEPPWMEQVCVTSELVYKYQILTKNVDEVLADDKRKMSAMEQPSLVNEQLGQLYLDLQLEGVAARLTLEEGVTSSSSSGEELTATKSSKGARRKREYSKLVMIYEEDAPLPPPPEPEDVSISHT